MLDMQRMQRAGWVMAVVTLGLLAQAAGLAQKAPAAGAPVPGPVVVMETSKGNITIETYPSEAPKTVENFLALVKASFYNRQHFHRVEKGFVAQIGDPDSKDLKRKEEWGKRGSGKPIGVAEFSKKLMHKKGAVGMAHAGDPLKADSQFYITLAPKKNLDGKYAVFGQVIDGMAVAEKLEVGDTVKRMYIK
jgi:cyclophilin family peptidyl-prolyl cis-trans isomerase